MPLSIYEGKRLWDGSGVESKRKARGSRINCSSCLRCGEKKYTMIEPSSKKSEVEHRTDHHRQPSHTHRTSDVDGLIRRISRPGPR